MSGRSYEGDPIDGTYQPISEAPYWQGEGETVDVVDDTELGEEQTENVPIPDGGTPEDVDGQTTLEDWGWSA